MSRRANLILLALALTSAGCARRGVTGGTEGVLHAGNHPLGEMQIVVYRIEGAEFRSVGMAATRDDGAFQLVTNGAAGPLRLTPGEYCCTLESVGAPLLIPKAYTKPETTPLKVTWTSEDRGLDLEASEISLP